MASLKLTKLEMEVMESVWRAGAPVSVREIQEGLGREAAYTTVQTIVGRLEEKGALRRVKKIGNAYLFEAVVTRKAVQKRFVDELLELFGGSAAPLISHLIETKKLTLEDIREAEAELERARARRKGR